MADIHLLFQSYASCSGVLRAVDNAFFLAWACLKEACSFSGAAFIEDKTALVQLCYFSVEKQHTLHGEVGLLQGDLARICLDAKAKRKSSKLGALR